MLDIRSIECKLRFGLSKLSFVPVFYSLCLDGRAVKRLLWSKVMPFFDQQHGLMHMELWGWDVPELRFLWRFCRPGMVVFDVGAHHGLYSLIAASRLGRTGLVVAFEPNPADARRTRWHARLNRLIEPMSPVRVEGLALADQPGRTSFHIPVSGVRTTAALQKPNDPRSRFKVISVAVDTLDCFLQARRIARLDLLKLDIEGAEMLFLNGARQSLASLEPVLIVEAIDDICIPWGHRARDVLERLINEFDYDLFAFTDDGRLTPHRLLDHYPLTSRCNYLAVPRSRVGSLIAKLIAPGSELEAS
jgi:FkbM family methyltransferase